VDWPAPVLFFRTENLRKIRKAKPAGEASSNTVA
jgi:hypothetical protein